MSYELKYLEEFLRRKNKIIKNNFVLFSRIESTLKILKTNPFYRSLQTHKITKSFGTCYSSRVMGDLRILWIFKENKYIFLLTVGGHSGKGKAY